MHASAPLWLALFGVLVAGAACLADGKPQKALGIVAMIAAAIGMLGKFLT